MRAASPRTSTWRRRKHVIAPLGILLFLRTGSVPAQDDRLRLAPGGASLYRAAVVAQLAPGPPPGRSPAPRDDLEQVLLEVDINRQGLDETAVFLKTREGMLLIGEDDLRRWRLRAPEGAARRSEGKSYYPLDAIPGATFRIDEARQAVTITAGP
jgi:hypothetical protein